MKMSRTQKEKLETYPEAPLQLTPENPTEESAVTAADGYNLNASLIKRKKEADKPLYLKRI
jgi:hypothetical protein